MEKLFNQQQAFTNDEINQGKKKNCKKKPTNKKQQDFTSLFLSLWYKIIPRTVILPYLIAALEYHLESHLLEGFLFLQSN